MRDPLDPYNIEKMNFEELKLHYKKLESQHSLTFDEATCYSNRLTQIKFALKKLTPNNWPRVMGLINDLVEGKEPVPIILSKWDIK